MKRAVVFVSGGLASWATAKLASKKHEQVSYLFNDVLIEDADLYRFLLEGMANVLGLPAPTDLMRRALALPDVDSDEHVEQRRSELTDIRAEAMRRMPGFIWQADGRTPWEAWADARFIGNSRTAHCSIDLKAAVGDAWVDAHCNPAHTVLEYGMYWDELHRILKLERVLHPFQLGRTLHDAGLTHGDIAAWAKCEGIPISRSYLYGYSHDNCSGLCCRAGQKHWAEKYRRKPNEARYVAGKEADMLSEMPATLPMLTDRSGDGKKKPLPLSAFFDRLDQQPGLIATLDDLGSGCGCVFDAMAGGHI